MIFFQINNATLCQNICTNQKSMQS